MNFTKPMIDLVQEIRRRVPSVHKPSIKLANPELLNELIPIYKESSDAVLQALLKELFFKAGDEWLAKLEAGDISDEKLVTKIYRGQVQLVSAKDASSKVASVAEKPRKVYRGRVVA
ncbi:hypothetical protein [Litoribrevibacter albus]|uniref:Uncharacterized protein n=1 Tax=Litoribrevibacter albus TaxID=1473156 RepID=A0AA37SBN6_9GAMM|nr:hypothetical protein [Litoribrevibacter albus]GLQ32259.1 hypothetical protein GCM10007876_27380 [Litoribrevibacter albus]